MTSYVLIKDGVVVQKQPYAAPGFIEAPDDAVCGMLFDGGGFSPPPPPEPPSPYIPLKPYQFWGAVRALGHEQDLKDWVAVIADPVQRGIASAMLEFSLEFRRDHPLIDAARVHLGMTETELDDLWLWGLTL